METKHFYSYNNVSDQQLINKCGQQRPPSLVISHIIIPFGITPALQILSISFNIYPCRCTLLSATSPPFHLRIMQIMISSNSFFSPLQHLFKSSSPSFPLSYLRENLFIHIFKALSLPPIHSCLPIPWSVKYAFLYLWCPLPSKHPGLHCLKKYLWHIIKFINLDLKNTLKVTSNLIYSASSQTDYTQCFHFFTAHLLFKPIVTWL